MKIVEMKESYNFYRGEKVPKELNKSTYFNVLTRGADPYNPEDSVGENKQKVGKKKNTIKANMRRGTFYVETPEYTLGQLLQSQGEIPVGYKRLVLCCDDTTTESVSHPNTMFLAMECGGEIYYRGIPDRLIVKIARAIRKSMRDCCHQHSGHCH